MAKVAGENTAQSPGSSGRDNFISLSLRRQAAAAPSATLAPAPLAQGPGATPDTTNDPSAQVELPRTASTMAEARAARERFDNERLGLAKSLMGGTEYNLERSKKELAGCGPMAWVVGLTDQLKKQVKAEEAYLELSRNKVAELEKRSQFAEQLMSASQRASSVGTPESQALAAELLEVVPAVLEMPPDQFERISSRLGNALRAVQTGRPAAEAREPLAVVRAAASYWARAVDPQTREPMRVAAVADTSQVMASYRSINTGLEGVVKNCNKMEYVATTGVVIAVGVVAVTVATGGLALPAILGGATIGTGFFTGAALGVGAGTLLGATAAWSEALGHAVRGQSWEQASAKASRDTWGYFKIAATSVAFGRVANVLGAAAGVVGNLVTRGAAGISRGIGSMLPQGFSLLPSFTPQFIRVPLGWVGAWMRRMVTPLANVGQNAVGAGATSGGMTIADKLYDLQSIEPEFAKWAKTQPQLDFRRPGLSENQRAIAMHAYLKAHEKFLDDHEVSLNHILWQAGKNTLISGFTASLFAGRPAERATFKYRTPFARPDAGATMTSAPLPWLRTNVPSAMLPADRTWLSRIVSPHFGENGGLRTSLAKFIDSRMGRHATGMAAGVGSEFVLSKVEETITRHPRDHAPRAISGNEVDEADAMRISAAHMWGVAFARPLNRAFYGVR